MCRDEKYVQNFGQEARREQILRALGKGFSTHGPQMSFVHPTYIVIVLHHSI
jgi:hypothetical protein